MIVLSTSGLKVKPAATADGSVGRCESQSFEATESRVGDSLLSQGTGKRVHLRILYVPVTAVVSDIW